MLLHTMPAEFAELISLVALEKHIPEDAVARDYDIVRMLYALSVSPYAQECVFKGGTSLSKCYPHSIERFSEDIDLTFLGMQLPDKACSKAIKKIEDVMSVGASTEKIMSERSPRSKSMYVWFRSYDNKIKLEIGSTVRPDPYKKRTVKSYIHEYLEEHGFTADIDLFELEGAEVNVLNIERTMIDKIMAVKRHALCYSLNRKVRHIYDVVRLYQLPEIQQFFSDKRELQRLVRLTKETDSFYIGRRNVPSEYNPLGDYGFSSWKNRFDNRIRDIYESLHKELLFTDDKQSFSLALDTFEKIDAIFKEIGE